MPYKIPPKELVLEEMLKILTESKIINSQKRFQHILIKQIKKVDASYELTPQRVRRLAAKSNEMVLEIHCREGLEKSESLTCPVCGTKMVSTKNKTLYDWEVVVGYKCDVCGYWTGTKRRIPIRYVFKLV
jgi:hypothetical protein